MGITKPSSKAASKLTKPPKQPLPQKAKNGVKVEGKKLVENMFGKTDKNISQGINDKLIKPLFETGPKDKALTIDVYGQTNTDVMNEFADKLKDGLKSILKGKSKDLIDSLKNKLPDKVGDALTNAMRTGKFDGSSIRDMVKSALGDKANLLNTVKNEAERALTGSLGIDPATFNKYKVLAGDTYSAIKSGSISSVNDTLKLVDRWCEGKIGEITFGDGKFKVSDIGSKAIIMKGIVDQAIKHNLSGTLDEIYKLSPNVKATIDSVKASCKTAFQKGDFKALETMVKHGGKETIRSQVPNPIGSLAKNYKLDENVKRSEVKNRWTEAQSLMTKFDRNWETAKRGNQTHKSLKAFVHPSKDWSRLVETDKTRTRTVVAAKVASKTTNRKSQPKQLRWMAQLERENAMARRAFETRRTG